MFTCLFWFFGGFFWAVGLYGCFCLGFFLLSIPIPEASAIDYLGLMIDNEITLV